MSRIHAPQAHPVANPLLASQKAAYAKTTSQTLGSANPFLEPEGASLSGTEDPASGQLATPQARVPATRPTQAPTNQALEQDTLSLSPSGLKALSGQSAPTPQADPLTYPNYQFQRYRRPAGG